MTTNQSNLLNSILSTNQNNHRLATLLPFEKLSPQAQKDIQGYCSSRGDRAHHAAGVLLYAFISRSNPVAVLSCRDLDSLILEASALIPEGSFTVRSTRHNSTTTKTSTIWSQLTGMLNKYGIIKILKTQNGKSPAVIEVIHQDWLCHIQNRATDEMRLIAINSTLQHYDTSRPQGLDTSILQYYNTTSVSETQNVTQDVTQESVKPEVSATLTVAETNSLPNQSLVHDEGENKTQETLKRTAKDEQRLKDWEARLRSVMSGK